MDDHRSEAEKRAADQRGPGFDPAEHQGRPPPPTPTHPVDRISGILDGSFEQEVDEYIEEIRGG